MSSIADFPMVLPQGTKMPGGVMVPVSSFLFGVGTVHEGNPGRETGRLTTRLSCRGGPKVLLLQSPMPNLSV